MNSFTLDKYSLLVLLSQPFPFPFLPGLLINILRHNRHLKLLRDQLSRIKNNIVRREIQIFIVHFDIGDTQIFGTLQESTHEDTHVAD